MFFFTSNEPDHDRIQCFRHGALYNRALAATSKTSRQTQIQLSHKIYGSRHYTLYLLWSLIMPEKRGDKECFQLTMGISRLILGIT
jgi:hypothetical protein